MRIFRRHMDDYVVLRQADALHDVSSLRRTLIRRR